MTEQNVNPQNQIEVISGCELWGDWIGWCKVCRSWHIHRDFNAIVCDTRCWPCRRDNVRLTALGEMPAAVETRYVADRAPPGEIDFGPHVDNTWLRAHVSTRLAELAYQVKKADFDDECERHFVLRELLAVILIAESFEATPATSRIRADDLTRLASYVWGDESIKYLLNDTGRIQSAAQRFGKQLYPLIFRGA